MALLESLWLFVTTTLLSKSIIFILIGIFGIGFIIAFHELGHLIFCKLFSIKAPSFSIGMGPRLLSKKFGTTEYSISAIPLGGYVEIEQAPEDGQPSTSDEGYFEQKPYWQKMLVMGGGILFNMIFAYTAFVLLYFTGMPNTPIAYPENATPIVSTILPEGPAQKAGLLTGDTILSINGTPIHGKVEKLFTLIEPLANQTTRFTLERDKNTVDIDVTLGERKQGGISVGFLGVGFETTALKPLPFLSALKRGVKRANFILVATMKSFKGMFMNRSIDGLGGPIMIISQTIQHAERGIKIFFTFLAVFSINLAILNLIPLPILDGGQALIATIEAILRRPLSGRIREYLALGTWAIFILLTLYLSFKDIKFIRALRAQKTEQATNQKP